MLFHANTYSPGLMTTDQSSEKYFMRVELIAWTFSKDSLPLPLGQNDTTLAS